MIQLKRLVTSGKDVQELGLYFEIDKVHPVTGKILSTEELIPSGHNIPVTNKNVSLYMNRIANFKLNNEIYASSKAFLRGFRQMIPSNWIRMFNPTELQMLISGEQRPIDLEDLKNNVTYSGGYHESQEFIQNFWNIIAEMDLKQQSLLLKFVTSCPRQPLLGFKQLVPNFGILKVPLHSSGVEEFSSVPKLPSAATCMNLLKLPQYPTKEMLKEKLLYAILSNSGFELT